MQNRCKATAPQTDPSYITGLECSPCIENITISSSGVVGICPVAAMHQSTRRQLLQSATLSLHRSPDSTPAGTDQHRRRGEHSSSEKRRTTTTLFNRMNARRALARSVGRSMQMDLYCCSHRHRRLTDRPPAKECHVPLVDNICVQLNGTLDPPARFAHRSLH